MANGTIDITTPFSTENGIAIPKYSTYSGYSNETKAGLFLRTFKSMDTYLSANRETNLRDSLEAIHIDPAQYLLDRLKGDVGYIQFLMLQCEMPLQEKYNLVRLAGDQYMVHFTGREPPLFSFGGVLVNAKNANHLDDFIATYNYYLRSSKTSRSGAESIVRFDNKKVAGQIVSMTSGLRGEQQLAASFSFNVLVRQLKIILSSSINASASTDGGVNEAIALVESATEVEATGEVAFDTLSTFTES